MERDSERPPQQLISHPAKEIDQFLDDMGLDSEWIGIVGGPHYEGDGEIVVSYNVRVIDGPYKGVVSAEFDYRYELEGTLNVEDVYPPQVRAIEDAYPDAEIQCYIPEDWQR